MADLKGRSIASSYKNLLQSSSEISSTNLKQIQSGSGNSLAMKLSTDKAVFTKVGIGNTGSVPDGLLHIMSTSAGTVTASSLADEAVLESSGSSGLSILSGLSSTGNVYFGDANNNDVGRISYDHSSDSFSFTTNGSTAMTLDRNSNLRVNGTVSQSEDRYRLEEYFHQLPYKDTQNTEQTGINTTITSHTKHVKIVTQAIDLAANEAHEITLTNDMIHEYSHVLAVLVDTSATLATNAMVNVMAYDINPSGGDCKIRISNGGVDIASMTFTILVTVDPHIDSNPHWTLSGANSRDSYLRYNGDTLASAQFFTGGADNDQILLYPKVANQGTGTDLVNVSPWRNINFHSQHQTELNVAVITHSAITNQAIWAGMKLTTTGVYATDNNQAYFLYATDDGLGALTTNGNLHFIYSIGGVDYITDLGITVTASTVYRLRIVFDENRKISVFVNNIQYGLTSTPTTTTAGGVTESVSTAKSLAMTSGAELLPIVAFQTLEASSKVFNVSFIKISRTLA